MSDAKRLDAIDILRGILVICVVLGHVIQQYVGTLGPSWALAKGIIYSFHMPAFAFVAGLCAQRIVELSGRAERLDYIRSRAIRLLVPYLVWGLLYFALRFAVGDVARITYRTNYVWLFFFGYNPDGAMWFLWALFAATVLMVPCARLFSHGWFTMVVGVVLTAVYCFIPRLLPCYRALYNVPVYFFFIGLGLYARPRVGLLLKSPGRAAWAVGAGFVAFVLTMVVKRSKVLPDVPWFVLTSVAASLALLGLSVLFAGYAGRRTRVLAFLGVEAMAIYVLGEPVKVCCRLLFGMFHLPVGVSAVLMLALMLTVPPVLARLVTRCGVLSVLLLGVKGERP